jgi:O-antigen/teichoic acid export membrane protein
MVVRGAAGVMAVNIVGVGAGFLAQFAGARTLGADRFGMLAYVLSWTTLLMPLAKFGLDVAAVRFLPAFVANEDWRPARGLLRRFFGIAAGMGVLVAAGLATAAFLHRGHDDELRATFLVGALVVPVLALTYVVQGCLQGLKRVVAAQTPLSMTRPLVFAAFLGGAYAAGRHLTAAQAMGLNVGATLLALTVGALQLRRWLPAPMRTVAPSYATRVWLRASLPMTVVGAMHILLGQIDVVSVGAAVGTTSAGIYSVCTRIALFVGFGMATTSAVVAPMIAETYARKDHDELARVVRTATAVGVVIAGSGVVGLALFGRWILSWFGPEFGAGASALWVLAGGHLLVTLFGPVGFLLDMTGHQDANARVNLVTTAITLALNYPAAKIWGMPGAAAVTMGCLLTKQVWSWFLVGRYVGIHPGPFGGHVSSRRP